MKSVSRMSTETVYKLHTDDEILYVSKDEYNTILSHIEEDNTIWIIEEARHGEVGSDVLTCPNCKQEMKRWKHPVFECDLCEDVLIIIGK